MTVFAPGSKVRIGPDHTVLGEVSEVIIRPGDAVFYQVYYWSGLDPRFIELASCHVFDVGEARIMTLGFNATNACSPLPAGAGV